MTRRRKTLIGVAAVSLVLASMSATTASADPLAGVPTDGLLVAYDFAQSSGTVLVDSAPTGGVQNGTIVGDPAWQNGVMRFTGSNHIRLPDDLLVGKTAASVVVEASPSPGSLTGNNFLWNLGGSGEGATGQFFVHTPGHRATISRTNWSGEQNAVSPAAFAADTWQSIVATIAPNAGSATSTLILYVDGVEVARNSSSTVGIADLAVQTNNLIGASAYAADPRFTGAISSYRLYDRALAANEVVQISQTDAAVSAEESIAGISLGDTSNVSRDLSLPTSGGVSWTTSDAAVVETDGTVHRSESGPGVAVLTATATVRGETATRTFEVVVAALPPAGERADADLAAITLHGLEDVRDNLALPESGSLYGSQISWSASPEGVIETASGGDRAPGFVTRPAAGSGNAAVTLTARVPGTDIRRDFAVTVRQLPVAEDTSAYLFAHFTSGLSPDTVNEQIYFAASPDGAAWTDLNESTPVLESTVGEQGARDPYLVRAPGGDKYYMIATDLSTARYGWRFTPDNPGSKNLVVWESDDLVTWSEPRLVDVASKIPQAGAAWAPEAIYDPRTGEYMVFWATASGAGAEHPLGNALGDWMNMYYATTRDFRTFSDPVKWIDRDHSVIDTTVIESDGVFYRASGDGQITIEASTDPRAVTVAPTALAENPGGWELVATLTDIFGPGYSGQQLEGPEFFEYNSEDRLEDATGEPVPTWGLIADQYSSGRGYLPFRTTDLSGTARADQGGSWSLGTDIDFGGLLKRHGTILPVTASEYDRVLRAYGEQADLDVSAVVTARCVGGKVIQVLSVSNGEAVPVTVSATGPHGAKTFTDLAPGKTSSAAFTTRSRTIGSGSFSLTAQATVDGSPVTVLQEAAYPAASCN
jgi:hypothetical protein